MFDKIINELSLFATLCGSCSENNAVVEFADALKLNGELNDERVLILKPDAFYSSKRMSDPPPSPDCLVLVKCLAEDHYDLYLVELKDVDATKQLQYRVIAAKFQTMAERFFVEFATIFDAINYGAIKFYLVTTYPKGGGSLSEEDYRKKIKGSHLDIYASVKPLLLFGKAVLIEPKPSPLILSAC